MVTDLNTYTGAVFSPCKTYRYALWRKWRLPGPNILFIGVNPSRGGEFYSDPTIKRAIKLAKQWDFSGLYFGNLYALRSPKVEPVIIADTEGRAVGAETDQWLKVLRDDSQLTVFAWGSWPELPLLPERVKQVHAMFPNAKCMGYNLDGSPKHPLLIKNPVQLYDYDYITAKP